MVPHKRNTEEEPIVVERKENEAKGNIVEDMEEGSLQAGQQSVRRRSQFEKAVLKLKHIAGNQSDNNTIGGLQKTSKSQLSSHGFPFDAKRATPFVPFSSNGSRSNAWIGLRQLSASFHSRVMLALRYVATASMRTGDANNTNTSTSNNNNNNNNIDNNTINTSGCALLLVVVLICVCLVGKVITSCFVDCASRDHPTPVLSQQSSNIGEAKHFLCQGLVIPPHCEGHFLLHVPIKPPMNFFRKQRRMNFFHLTDAEGTHVLELHIEHASRSVALTAGNGGIIAQCMATPVDGPADEFLLLRGESEYFAKLVQGGLEEPMNCPSHEEPSPTWTIRTHAGVEWFLFDPCDSYALKLKDNQDRILAVAQESETWDQPGNADKTYDLRVAPLMDVSIAVCGLLVASDPPATNPWLQRILTVELAKYTL